MKKSIVILLLLFSFVYSFSQNKIEGFVYDAQNNPIDLASIRFEGFGIGTVSNSNGKFSILTPDSVLQSRLTFSHINYYPKLFLIKELEAMRFKVTLEQKTIDLNEVIIARSQNITKWKKTGSIYLGKTHIGVLGTECGIMVDIKKEALLRQIKFKVETCTYDSITAYVRIYKYDKHNKELSDVLFSKKI